MARLKFGGIVIGDICNVPRGICLTSGKRIIDRYATPDMADTSFTIKPHGIENIRLSLERFQASMEDAEYAARDFRVRWDD